MKRGKIFSIVAVGAIAISTNPALSETETASQVTFTCEVKNSIPTTILKTGNNQKTIFNWQSEYLPKNRNPLTLCNTVTEKLNNYSENKNNDLSALTFKADTLGDLPAVCATDEPEACNTKLFTLSPSFNEPSITIANNVLDSILDKDLQTVREIRNDRGLQSVSHSIDIWELILGRKLMKNF